MGFVRAMSSKAVTTGAARNGDGPVPVSTYQDSGFVADQAWR
jgi:multiple sugar transport system substrate-binding protein